MCIRDRKYTHSISNYGQWASKDNFVFFLNTFNSTFNDFLQLFISFLQLFRSFLQLFISFLRIFLWFSKGGRKGRKIIFWENIQHTHLFILFNPVWYKLFKESIQLPFSHTLVYLFPLSFEKIYHNFATFIDFIGNFKKCRLLKIYIWLFFFIFFSFSFFILTPYATNKFYRKNKSYN